MSNLANLYRWKGGRRWQEKLGKKTKAPAAREVTLFIRQLSLLISTHIPLVQALKSIRPNLDSSWHFVIDDCLTQIQSGRMLSYALNRHPCVFSEFFCHWVEAGELSGTLDVLLEYWVAYQEKSEAIQNKVKKALTYPCFILCVTLLISLILFVGVVPMFETLFHQWGVSLPFLTQGIVLGAHLFQFIALPLFVVFSLSMYIFCKVPAIGFWRDKWILKVPFIGKMVKEVAVIQFAKALSVMLTAGFPLSEALTWTAKVVRNRCISSIVLQWQRSITSGISLHQAITSTAFVAPLLNQMVSVGEASGTLDKALALVSHFYEQKLFHMLENLSQLIEPVMMVIIGLITGVFMLAMYLPIFQLGGLF